jgi:hypothetical protein
MEKFHRRFIVVLLSAGLFPVIGALNLSVDADARYRLSEWEKQELSLEHFGVLARQTFSDGRGDRFILSGLFEAENNFKELSLHELWARYKGPLNKWSVTAGRFTLPFGLLYSFDASRLIYEPQWSVTIGVDVDNGLMLSGVINRFDYSLAITQGYGHHHVPQFPGYGLGTARLGIALGETDEFNIGISGAFGKTAMHENREMAITRGAGAIDATIYAGQFLLRTEIVSGKIEMHSFVSFLSSIDYALCQNIDITAGGAAYQKNSLWDNRFFTTITFKPPWLTIRGGYEYAYHRESKHNVTFQLYRLFSFTF